MLQPNTVPATPLIERLRSGAGRRTLALILVLLIEGLLLLLLLSLGFQTPPGRDERRMTVMNLPVEAAPDEAAEPAAAEPAHQAEELPAPRPQPPAQDPQEPLPPEPAAPIPPPIAPAATPAPPRPPSIPTPPRSAAPAPPARAPYGPPDKGRPSAFRDTERVGTAPNGEPLYAAAWYREPDPVALRSYLSTARGPGWGLIACRTVSNYRVEDCVALDEYPEGSQINRAILAAAWEFKVRPPQRGGRPLVGSWVRIRIEYSIGRP